MKEQEETNLPGSSEAVQHRMVTMEKGMPVQGQHGCAQLSHSSPASTRAGQSPRQGEGNPSMGRGGAGNHRVFHCKRFPNSERFCFPHPHDTFLVE